MATVLATTKLEGMEKLSRKMFEMDEVLKQVSRETAREQGEMLADRIRANIPTGPTGNLKRSVVVKAMPGGWPIIVGIDRRIAPHAHLVEFGTSTRSVQSAKVLTDGETFFGKEVAPMGDNPFFRPAVDGSRDQVLRNMESDMKKAIDR